MKLYAARWCEDGWVVVLEEYDEHGRRLSAREITTFGEHKDADEIAGAWNAKVGIF